MGPTYSRPDIRPEAVETNYWKTVNSRKGFAEDPPLYYGHRPDMPNDAEMSFSKKQLTQLPVDVKWWKNPFV